MPHLVADEIRRRGIQCRHLLSWDDFDRLRKVPAGIDPSWAEHIGKPLTSVPAPPGSEYASWSEHFKAPMLDALTELGIEVDGISQTQMYTSGAYREQILFAMRERAQIDLVLARYRTLESAPDDDEPGRADTAGAASAASASDYYPYKPYCAVCERDLTTVTSYEDDTTALTYACDCGHHETVLLSEHSNGKLVWKVDWPMRWAYEGVIFEPSGVDHQSPGSSFVVGGRLVHEVFGGTRPIGPMYAFVGISGMAKMSSSRGGVPTPTDALAIMEAPLLRWLYARRKPAQSFNIAFDQEIHRLYDEWDALAHKVADGSALPGPVAAYRRATRTAAGELRTTPRPLPYRTLASVADITTGDDEQTLRILSELDPARPLASLDEARPRLTCAQTWALTQLPADQRTKVRDEPDAELLASLTDDQRAAVQLLAGGLGEHWSLQGLTAWVYAVPKIRAGLPPDAKAKTPELKAAQREFFALVYRLLIGTQTGPRLPTLLLAVGVDRALALLTSNRFAPPRPPGGAESGPESGLK